jgi:hypothetical protein
MSSQYEKAWAKAGESENAGKGLNGWFQEGSD